MKLSYAIHALAASTVRMNAATKLDLNPRDPPHHRLRLVSEEINEKVHVNFSSSRVLANTDTATTTSSSVVACSWKQKGEDINGEANGDWSGARGVSLSADGKTVAIGAKLNGYRTNGSGRGHTRIYRFDDQALPSPGQWVQVGDDIDGEDAIDESGYAVSLSSDGMSVAIGAPYNDGNGNDSGHVRVYELKCVSELQLDFLLSSSSFSIICCCVNLCF